MNHLDFFVNKQAILPPATIGILGGGQLGRMMALSGRNMGYRFVTLDPSPGSPCGQVSNHQIVASYDDLDAAKQFASLCDIVTYEFENVDRHVTEQLMQYAYVPQGANLLAITQNRLNEKQALEFANVPVVPYQEINSLESLLEAVDRIGLPCVLKTVTGGYDGKGQFVIHHQEHIQEAWNQLSCAHVKLILEKWISLEKEISVIVARTASGEVKEFPVAENHHVHNILHTSIVPARISPEIEQDAIQIAIKIAHSLQVVGLIAVEFFISKQQKLYVNEMAPRPHNSGHYTMEACMTSQFEQHLRAICQLPLGSTKLLSPVVMVNLLGEHIEGFMHAMAKGQLPQDDELSIKIHLYGKQEIKEKRKMGHLNILTQDIDKALMWITKTEIWK